MVEEMVDLFLHEMMLTAKGAWDVVISIVAVRRTLPPIQRTPRHKAESSNGSTDPISRRKTETKLSRQTDDTLAARRPQIFAIVNDKLVYRLWHRYQLKRQQYMVAGVELCGAFTATQLLVDAFT